jgi:hypothetical protein
MIAEYKRLLVGNLIQTAAHLDRRLIGRFEQAVQLPITGFLYRQTFHAYPNGGGAYDVVVDSSTMRKNYDF